MYTMKKQIGEDEYNKLFFEMLYMANSDNVESLKDLCSKNPEKCRQKRPDLCKKILRHLGYNCSDKEDACKIYVELSEFFKKKKIASFIPKKESISQSVLENINEKGSDELKNFIVKNGFVFKQPSISKKSSTLKLNK